MLKTRCIGFAVIVSFLMALLARADSTWEYSVQVSATVQTSPAQITLNWPQDTVGVPTSYTVYRKALNATSWGTGTVLSGTTTSYVDKNVTVGSAYEYQIVKNASTYIGTGYIYAGINTPMTESRGKLVLLVDNTYASQLTNELARLQQDLTGDGWTVLRHDVSRNDTVPNIKAVVQSEYNADPANVNAVFIFGHVPVPYSGDMAPDGHIPNHMGAWSADVYYGNMHGNWTDSSVNDSSADYDRNHNVPGDGKFDQSSIPGQVELMVGRVDLANMPGQTVWNGPATFPSELELLRNYLNKDHKFRMNQMNLPRRGVVGDYFGSRNGEAFAASGWRNFSTFFGASNVTTLANQGTWLQTLSTTPYLWAYACGSGSFSSIGGIGSETYNDGYTTDLVNSNIQAVFTLLFGSWLGDFDAQDDIMRGVLASSSYGLTCAWSGRPHWFCHHMALGMPIGYSARVTQNNSSSGMYQTQVNSAAGGVHIALMGDPTLRMHVVSPVTSVAATANSGNVSLNWGASPDSVVGYNVYRSDSPSGPFTRLNSSTISGTSYVASGTTSGTFMVRAVKLETSASGTYYNPSQGVFATVGTTVANTNNNNTNTTVTSTNSTGSSDTGSTTTVQTPISTNVSLALTNFFNWVDDAVPAGAQSGADGGDSWNWVSSNPGAATGSTANQSSIGAGEHQHFFTYATTTMNVNAGDTLAADVYLDPANTPTEIMLQWNDGTWEHRAYWGANSLAYGTDATVSRQYMGALPAAGQWTQLLIPASSVGLVGSAVNGMAFTQYGGRATWDAAGKGTAIQVSTPVTTTNNPVTTTNTTGSTSTVLTNFTVWMDDAVPAGAQSGADGGDAWTWVSSNPAPFSGSAANQSSIGAGEHQHYFSYASNPMSVNSGDTLVAYVYLDPANPPTEVMLQWFDGNTWEHRAYWGANSLAYGTDATVSRQSMGALPTAGQWAPLFVPAASIGLAGSSVSGMAFTQYGGRATWDAAGKGTLVQVTTPVTTTNVPPVTTTNTGYTTNIVSVTNFVNWVDDVLPPGSIPVIEGGDTWVWVSNPAAYSGKVAHQSKIVAGEHQHYFTNTSSTLKINKGDILVTSVYLDATNTPSEVLLKWYNGSWEHRAYWGSNVINMGTNGTAGRYYAGALPAKGKWVQLSVPASQVGLEGATLNGMGFSIYNGRATYDASGKISITQITNVTGTTITTTNTSGGSTNTQVSTPTTVSNFVAWVDDALPTGAAIGYDGGDSWTWVNNSPAPFSGKLANQSAISVGEHQHYFTGATTTLPVNTGDSLVAYVYIDPVNPPTEIMLQWYAANWEHRAYWGSNLVGYGTDGTVSRHSMGALPSTGKWVPLIVPASVVGLEGSTLNGMAFTAYNGRVTWDAAGKSSATSNPGPVTSTNGGNGTVTGTNTSGNTLTNATPTIMSAVDNTTLRMPQAGDNALRILSPTTLELVMINTKAADPATVTSWNFVNSSSQLQAPAASQLAVTVNGQPVSIQSIGFKRRPLYASSLTYDLRVENNLYLQLATPITNSQTVVVKNPDGTLWASTTQFTNTASALRFNPAIHVNQEGYAPALPKKAMIGYYLGSLGEMNIPSSTGFQLVDASSGNTVYSGTLSSRPDTGWNYSPTPYQKVLLADFSNFKTPGEYQVVIPGYGASLPFLINDGVAMDFARAYALGLYGQRCGTNNAMPYSRFTHGVCHAAPAQVPDSSYTFTWNTIAGYSGGNSAQTAPQLVSDATSIFPFVNKGSVDVHGGHHDAGDYSKYTVNVASLTHYLMFAVDSLPGVSAMDNLGIPESGDGIPDLLQEAKWEADYLSRLQDADGAFYFIVYPQNREYESNVTPDHGDPQVVWPKNTVSTAAAVAALAQCASSPQMKKYYPAEAAAYLAKAKLGWACLSNAIAKYGKTGAYQKITFYGDNFNDADELAWAACQMYLATGDSRIHQLLLQWFNPSDPATWRWGWWHMSECYGHAIRSYAFAVQSGRVQASQLDATFLAKCKAEITQAANDAQTWSSQSAYGTSFPAPTKAVNSAGWYFGDDFGFDLAVGYQLNPSASYVDAIVANMNYEGGCNPVNVTYVTGLGWKRERNIVSQMALNDGLTLPPTGMPIGNIQQYFPTLSYPNYGTGVENLCFPSDGATTAPYPFYDRWGDTWNVTTEMVGLNLARGMADLAFLASLTTVNGAQPYTAQAGKIVLPTNITVNTSMTATFQAPAGMDLNGARIVWEAQFQEPAYGPTYTIKPQYTSPMYIHAEAQWPDGRRAFATNVIAAADSPLTVWVGDTLPGGATVGADGGDSWNWVSSPTPYSGAQSHQSANVAGEHQQFFYNATGTLKINTGDTLFTYVYLDPSNPPTEIMLQWNDGSWEHRAYWGADSLGYGADGSVSRVSMGALPATGKWVQLAIPASKVGLEGSTLNGMAFTAYGGQVTWDYSGKASAGTAIQ